MDIGYCAVSGRSFKQIDTGSSLWHRDNHQRDLFHLGVGVILVCHIRYRKTRPDLHASSSFKAPFAPFINYAVLALFAFILVIMLFADATRPALLLTPLWFIGLFLIYRARGRKTD